MELEDWKKAARTYLVKANTLINNSSKAKELVYRTYATDGKIIQKPKLLLIGINPGKGSGKKDHEWQIEFGERLSYLDHLDKYYHYHLAAKTIKFLKDIGVKNDEIYNLLKEKTVKTNFNYFATIGTKELSSLKRYIKELEPFRKSCELTVGLIKSIKPRVVLFEGKIVYDHIIKVCYEKKNTWDANSNFGYYFSKDENIHFVGYNRRRNAKNTRILREVVQILNSK